ncbi:MAG: transporter substrate-binding domain-containing protein [Spirochaetes bacterium]|nr:transporter substrate-binding domain-containing protein [Spirochaetota bacterium]
MKKYFSLLLILISVLSFSQSKIILTTGEWAPYTSKSMSEYGAFTEILTAVLKEMGVNYEYQWYPWKRAEDEVRKGNAFACFPYLKNEERLKVYDYSEPLLSSTGKFFYLRSNIKKEVKWASLADFKSFTMGGVGGYWYLSEFEKAGLKIDLASSDESNISKLYNKRIDFALTDELVGWDIIKKQFPNAINQFATLDKPFNENYLHLMVSRKYPNSKKLMEQFNKAFASIKSKGIYARILKKYNL